VRISRNTGLRDLLTSGLTRCLFAGLAQQEPTDPTGIMARLRRKATLSDDMVYLGQYDNENNWKAHATWTGPQILKQLPEVTVFSTTVGTGGKISHLCDVVSARLS
jgi:cysteine synthase